MSKLTVLAFVATAVAVAWVADAETNSTVVARRPEISLGRHLATTAASTSAMLGILTSPKLASVLPMAGQPLWPRFVAFVVLYQLVAIGFTVFASQSRRLRRRFANGQALNRFAVAGSGQFASFIHAMVSGLGALALCARPSQPMHADHIFAEDPAACTLVLHSAGYFLSDMMDLIRSPIDHQPMYMLHHAMAMIAFMIAFYSRFAFYGVAFLLFELSTPFLALRWAILNMKLDKPQTMNVLNAAFALTFFAVRLGFGMGVVSPRVFRELWRVAVHGTFDENLFPLAGQGLQTTSPALIQNFARLIVLVVAFFNCLNVFFSTQIVSMLRKTIKRARGSSTRPLPPTQHMHSD
ncbi:unnamed protein product (mitochondrion) [Plasmodiophora brassicae]|uniref:TLC domain-containing protein n=1 Tax=Plasmodiophora brassicae TaxID=37360 RepID=A0A0G4IW34_PLABS|nr:hypothetical protein PBRA_001182 [Plasmodiophora brassicae]SPQ97289.1 unnamed protein product [Plasmodiophora brassicae]